MNIDEAIKSLEDLKELYPKYIFKQFLPSIQLGIEALSYINICRSNPNCYHISMLKGETK